MHKASCFGYYAVRSRSRAQANGTYSTASISAVRHMFDGLPSNRIITTDGRLLPTVTRCQKISFDHRFASNMESPKASQRAPSMASLHPLSSTGFLEAMAEEPSGFDLRRAPIREPAWGDLRGRLISNRGGWVLTRVLRHYIPCQYVKGPHPGKSLTGQH
jgi:hypothetical protein